MRSKGQSPQAAALAEPSTRTKGGATEGISEPTPPRAALSVPADILDKRVDELLTDEAGALIEENFAGVEADWWWERRLSGNIAICQEFDPDAMALDMAEVFGLKVSEIRRRAVRELGLEDFEPVVLVYDLASGATVEEAAGMLRERSATAAGLAEGIYRQVAEALKRG